MPTIATTPVINAQPFGFTPNVAGVSSVMELDPSTTQVILWCSVTLSDAGGNMSTRQHVRYAWSPTAYATPDIAKNILLVPSRYVEILLTPLRPSLTLEQSSPPIPVPGGGFLYVWTGSPNLPAMATLTVNVIESN